MTEVLLLLHKPPPQTNKTFSLGNFFSVIPFDKKDADSMALRGESRLLDGFHFKVITI